MNDFFASAVAGPPELPARVEPRGTVTAKILAVDDDPRNLLAVREMLASPGIEVVTAASGPEALRLVLRDDFAVILLDVQMPGMDGYEVAGLIRNRPRSSRVPIIFLTAFNKDDVHVFRGYSAGAVDYVFKPIEPLILKSKIDVLVDLYRKTEEIRRQGEEERRLLLENLRVRGEKLKAEQALRRRDEHQTLVLGALPIALYTASLEEDHRRLHFTNDSISRITGFAPEDFLRSLDFWETRLHPDDHDRVIGALDMAGQDAVTLDYRWRCADDSERTILDHLVVIRDDDGRPREYFGMWLDNTDRRQLEQQLLHASKLEAIGRLTGGIAHDFNNMLAVVMGSIELLQRSLGDNKSAQRRADMAMEGARRCADLTNRLLTFSRRQSLQSSVTDLRILVPAIVELIRRTLGERIEIDLDIPEAVWPVFVDRSQFETALINLAVNARDAMPTGGRLTIAVRNRPETAPEGEEASEMVEVSVADTGEGMAPEVLEHVFEPFFTTKESGKGTGLGLSMIYGFAQQSGGRITIESQPGEGTTVRLVLPRTDRAFDGVAEVAAAGVPPPEGNGETILVVEDDPDVRQVAVSTLTNLGYTVREAANGDEALTKLRDGGTVVRLVFSDVTMPGPLTGVDLAREVRRLQPDIGVLLTTGYVGEDVRLDEGVEILPKPYQTQDLAQKLRGLLRSA
ncbi:response regulator [Salinarimonas soli]|uniref:histidine kinase n=1 Tax=Salinarimonas soli TaxID=1638099 RepID=A0A5B2V2A3_9HYPH|nr:response regulator [Salinarimonas soli]KAA2233124.1 response regulator [Salinarimonas soli]